MNYDFAVNQQSIVGNKAVTCNLQMICHVLVLAIFTFIEIFIDVNKQMIVILLHAIFFLND